jgi:hypothetical protein
MIEKLFNHPYVLYQTTDVELPNPAIAGYIDNGDAIVLSQEGRYIVIDYGSVPELRKLLKKLAATKVKK